MIRADLGGVKVGDRVVVLADSNKLGGGTFVVAAIGPKCITIAGDFCARKFRRDNGQEKSAGVGGYCVLMTEHQFAEHEEREREVGRLRDHVLRAPWQWYHELTADQARRVLAILTESE